MQLTLAALSAMAVVSSALAIAVERPLAFTTFPCIECKATGPGGCEAQNPQISYHPALSEQCYPLNARHQSIRVDDAQPNCVRKCSFFSYHFCRDNSTSGKLTIEAVHLYSTANCSGNGPSFPFEGKPGNCKPIPAGENVSYKVLCN
jgi:hypothetical protein